MQYHFADCVLDTGSFRLLRGGEVQAVEPQVFDLLCVLAENAGALVSRDKLIETVWKGRIVSDATISARINAARSAVGDDGKRQAVIRTVPRRGIELAVPVTHEGAAAAGPRGSQVTRYTTSADGTMLAYAISGDGLPLLKASHHVTHLELDWLSPLLRPTFDALGATHQLVRYDMRGAGLSDSGGTVSPMRAHVEDLLAVADAAGLERFPILATLNSVAVAIQCAAEHPERVSKLVLQQGYARGRALRGAPDTPARDDPFLSLIHAGGWGDPQSGLMRAWMTMAVPGLRFDEITELITYVGKATSARESVINRETIDRFDARPYLGKVSVPTLVIHARNDVVHPITEGRLIAAGIEGAEFLVVESGNTLCLTPDPTWQQQTDAILEFLARD